jgi:hypothetical protein
MLIAPLNRKFHYYNNMKSQLLSILNRKVLSGGNYFGKNTYYRAILNQYTNFCSYTNILNETANLNSIESNADIQPRMLGANTKSIVSKYGKPVFVFSENKITIYVYKWKFNELKTRCEIHFYNGTVFLVNYIYNQLNSDEKNYIVKTITQKYIGQDEDTDIMNCKVTDRNNNIIRISDFFEGLKVTYLSNKSLGWHLGLISDINLQKENQKSKIRLAERLFYNNI